MYSVEDHGKLPVDLPAGMNASAADQEIFFIRKYNKQNELIGLTNNGDPFTHLSLQMLEVV